MRVRSRLSSQSRIAPSMNQSQACAAVRIFGGGGSPASSPSRMREVVEFLISSSRACTSGTLPTLSISLR